MKHLYVHACDEHAREYARVLCVVQRRLLCAWVTVDAHLFRDGELSAVASQPSALRARRCCATYLRLRPSPEVTNRVSGERGSRGSSRPAASLLLFQAQPSETLPRIRKLETVPSRAWV